MQHTKRCDGFGVLWPFGLGAGIAVLIVLFGVARVHVDPCPSALRTVLALDGLQSSLLGSLVVFLSQLTDDGADMSCAPSRISQSEPLTGLSRGLCLRRGSRGPSPCRRQAPPRTCPGHHRPLPRHRPSSPSGQNRSLRLRRTLLPLPR